MIKDRRVMAGGALLLGAAGFWFVLKPQFLDAAPPVVYTEEQIQSAPRPTLTMDEVVLNLLAPPTNPAYIKVQLAIEFADPNREYLGLSPDAVAAKNDALAHELDPDMHRIKDVINGLIGARTPAEVTTPEGREALKQALVAALNEHITSHHVENVYFVTFITQ